MNLKFITILVIFPLSLITTGFAQRLSPFESATLSTGEKNNIGMPYGRTVSYFGYISDSTATDSLIEDKPAYFLFVHIPADVSELGIRIISPVPELFFADRGDIEPEEFTALTPIKRNSWFDPGMVLENMTPDSTGKFSYGPLKAENFKSKDVPSQPNGKFENPMIRLTNVTVKAGYYRITLINEKPETQKSGSFVMQIGTVPDVKGIKVSRSQFDMGR